MKPGTIASALPTVASPHAHVLADRIICGSSDSEKDY